MGRGCGGDFDNDGREDVLVYRYGYLAPVSGMSMDIISRMSPRKSWPTTLGEQQRRDLARFTTVMGLLDLYVTAYFRSDNRSLAPHHDQRSCTTASSSPPTVGKNLLFHNLGGGKIRGCHRSHGCRPAHDGLSRQAVGRFQRRWLARHLSCQRLWARRVVSQRSRAGDSSLAPPAWRVNPKSGMSATLGDAFNRGRLDAFRHEHLRGADTSFQNNNLRFEPDGRSRDGFRNVAEGALADAGWAWGRAVR